MKVRYDFHTHSGLSPCADKDMTPANIVGLAAVNGLHMVAISDHNAIDNVKVAMKIGEAYGVLVVPAFELQTEEDIHLLCLFKTYEGLTDFYNTIKFKKIKNESEIFGNQYIYDEDDNIIGEKEFLLLNSAEIASYQVPSVIRKYDGVAVPAHIDREANGMLNILGAVTPEFSAVEFSARADKATVEEYKKKFNVITDSDAHTLADINLTSDLELPDASAESLVKYLLQKR